MNNNKTWKIGTGEKDFSNYPETILQDFAKKLNSETEGKFDGIVTEFKKSDSKNAVYALHVIPNVNKEGRSYDYRLIEVVVNNILNPYPTSLNYFARDSKNNKYEKCNDSDELKTKIQELAQSEETSIILLELFKISNRD